MITKFEFSKTDFIIILFTVRSYKNLIFTKIISNLRRGMNLLVILRASISCVVSNMRISQVAHHEVHKSHIIKPDGLIIGLRRSSARDHQGSLVTPLSANQHSLIASHIPLSCFL